VDDRTHVGSADHRCPDDEELRPEGRIRELAHSEAAAQRHRKLLDRVRDVAAHERDVASERRRQSGQPWVTGRLGPRCRRLDLGRVEQATTEDDQGGHVLDASEPEPVTEVPIDALSARLRRDRAVRLTALAVRVEEVEPRDGLARAIPDQLRQLEQLLVSRVSAFGIGRPVGDAAGGIERPASSLRRGVSTRQGQRLRDERPSLRQPARLEPVAPQVAHEPERLLDRSVVDRTAGRSPQVRVVR
jgi:hypothetical protein